MVLHLGDIQIRDPFVLTVAEESAYYLFGSTDKDLWHTPAVGFDCYRSRDLEYWEGPIAAFRPPAGFWSDRDYWAPEVHRYGGRYFMFASFAAVGARRGTQVLVAEEPAGPFAVWSDRAVTPPEWDCLDGTLYVDAMGNPWLVYCHEWLQVYDGQIVAQRLTDDLSSASGDPKVLFTASEAPWVSPFRHTLSPPGMLAYVTDGPFVHRLPSGQLMMLWSSFGPEGYAVAVARSATGSILGPWTHDAEPLWRRDGGHAMLARTLTGELLLVFHQPNKTPLERAMLHPVVETDYGLSPTPAAWPRPEPGGPRLQVHAAVP